MFCGFFFFQFLTPSTGEVGHNFLVSNPFRKKLVRQMRQEEAFKFCLDIRNNRALPLDPACPQALPLDPAGPERLSVRSPAVLPRFRTVCKMTIFHGRFWCTNSLQHFTNAASPWMGGTYSQDSELNRCKKFNMGPGSRLLLEPFTSETASYLDRRWWMRLITLFPCLRILQ